MNPDCERALLEMDTLADPEWLQGHLAGCATCRAEAALRERVRVGLQRAVRATPVDARMESRVRVAMASMVGVSMRQGMHHSAQKSTSTGTGLFRTSDSKLASVNSRVLALAMSCLT